MNSPKVQESNNIQMTSFILNSSKVGSIDQVENEKEQIRCDYDDMFLAETDFECLPEKRDRFSAAISQFHSWVGRFMLNNSKVFKWTIALIILILYTIYFIWSMICKIRNHTLFTVEDNIRLLWLSIVIYLAIGVQIIREILKWRKIKCICCKCNTLVLEKVYRICFYVFCGLGTLGIAIYVIYTAITHNPYNLVSLLGIIVLLSISYVFSTAPHMVNWKPVLLGILLQFLFALIILTTTVGFQMFKFIGDRVSEFLQHTEAGCILVFGNDFAKHYFAFRILPIIVFLSTVMSILYYLGVVQILVIVIGMSMQKFMGTTYGESLNAAANIFLGMSEAPLLIKPLLGRMTNSELHAIMTGGFATIAGSVLGAYIGYGAPANHLISASVMSAPAALAISKLMCPETKKSKNTKDDVKHLPKSPYQNIIEATTAGASESIPLVANIAVNLIAFVAILAFFNATLAWIGERACMSRTLSFELICSYLFWPLSLCMGVYFEDCRKVAELIGIKTFLNEFLAYERLGKLLANRKIYDSVNQTVDRIVPKYDDISIYFKNGTNVILNGGVLMQNRSVVISTYALCGFANFGSMGILLSSLSTMIPHRRADLSKLIVRAMIAGNIACFLTACIAGLFYKE